MAGDYFDLVNLGIDLKENKIADGNFSLIPALLRRNELGENFLLKGFKRFHLIDQGPEAVTHRSTSFQKP